MYFAVFLPGYLHRGALEQPCDAARKTRFCCIVVLSFKMFKIASLFKPFEGKNRVFILIPPRFFGILALAISKDNCKYFCKQKLELAYYWYY